MKGRLTTEIMDSQVRLNEGSTHDRNHGPVTNLDNNSTIWHQLVFLYMKKIIEQGSSYVLIIYNYYRRHEASCVA
jgi:hypothetical protein